MNSFQISMLRYNGLSVAEIAEKTELTKAEVVSRLMGYNNLIASEIAERAHRAGKARKNEILHPERNGGYMAREA